jgi:hypothetical protein
MVLWDNSLSPHLKVLDTSTPSFVSVLLSPRGLFLPVHTAVYLPTAGRDGEWLVCLVELEHHLTDIMEEHSGKIASSKNMSRARIDLDVLLYGGCAGGSGEHCL